MLYQYTDSTFNNKFISTVGIDFREKRIVSNNMSVRFPILFIFRFKSTTFIVVRQCVHPSCYPPGCSTLLCYGSTNMWRCIGDEKEVSDSYGCRSRACGHTTKHTRCIDELSGNIRGRIIGISLNIRRCIGDDLEINQLTVSDVL